MNARRELLEAAGYNILRLRSGDIPLDYFSDVPARVAVPAVAEAAAAVLADDASTDLSTELAELCPTAKLAVFTKGRAAEAALVEALGLSAPVVITHGLFATAQQALAQCKAVVEPIGLARPSGTSDIDIDALRARLAAGRVDLVYLETANNALAGWPLSEANVVAARELCSKHGARLVLDATRAFANAARQADDVFAAVRRLLALADAFTISCGKEYLFPYGAVLGSPDPELVGRAAMAGFRAGTALGSMEPSALRVGLRAGYRWLRAHGELLLQRTEALAELADRLERAGMRVVRPLGVHAVFVELPAAIAAAVVAMPSRFSLAAHLFVVGGLRGHFFPVAGQMTLRLALPLAYRIDPLATAEALRAFFDSAADAPQLDFAPGQPHLHPIFRALTPAQRRTS